VLTTLSVTTAQVASPTPAAPPAAGTASELPLESHRLRDRVIAVRCGNNNVGVIATAAGLIVVDTHRSPSLMRALAERIATDLGRDDFRWVVNTHGHWDHASGNQVFPEAIRIGHVRCREYVAASTLGSPRSRWSHERRLSRLSRRLADSDPASHDAERIRVDREIERAVVADLDGVYLPTPPTRTFAERTEIAGHGVTVQVIYCGEGHTDHDVFVWVPEERVLFTGDVFCSGHGFCFSFHALADAPRLVSVLDEILETGSEDILVVPGHGDFLTRADLVRLRDLARERFEGVRPEKSAARFLSDHAESVGWVGAANRLETAMRRRPDRYDVSADEVAVLAERWLGRGRVDDARRLLDWAIERAPDSALLWGLAGDARWRSGDAPGARRAYERTLELLPRHRGASEGLEWLRLSAGSPPR
jgi:glyoxylase-like metal-dependent hydrolase (beta-lactamase superfamily II)